MFRRRRANRGGDGDEPDPTFGYLRAGEAAAVRSLVRQAFAERGLEVVVHPDHVVASDGGQYGLSNIAALCHNLPRSQWPGAARHHVESVLRAVAAPVPEELSQDELLSRVFVRVMGTSTLSDTSQLGYRRTLGGDLVELLALDYDDHVVLLDDRVVSRYDLAVLRHAGLANLLAEPFGDFEVIKADRKTGYGLLVGDSVYTASRLLTMDDVLRRTRGDAGHPDGVLVCVPTRHELAFHVPTDPGVISAMQAMAVFAATAYAEGMGSVSPYLYWQHGHELHQLTTVVDDGTLQLTVEGHLADIVDRLTRRDRD